MPLIFRRSSKIYRASEARQAQVCSVWESALLPIVHGRGSSAGGQPNNAHGDAHFALTVFDLFFKKAVCN